MKVNRLSGEELVKDGDTSVFSSLNIRVFRIGDQALKIPSAMSSYEDLNAEFLQQQAEFTDMEFYAGVLRSMQQAGVALPEPWAVEQLSVDDALRTCFWQRYYDALCYSPGTFGDKLPLRPSRNFLPGEYVGPEFVSVDSKKIFFDWDLYFLYLHDTHLRDVRDYSRRRLEEICTAIATGQHME